MILYTWAGQPVYSAGHREKRIPGYTVPELEVPGPPDPEPGPCQWDEARIVEIEGRLGVLEWNLAEMQQRLEAAAQALAGD